MLQGLFARLPGLSALEKERGETREFKGDGTEYLSVSGLKKLDICRVGQMTIPQETEQEFPDNTKPHGQSTIKVMVPMLSLIAEQSRYLAGWHHYLHHGRMGRRRSRFPCR